MASLIPAEVIAQLLARRGQVQTVPTGMDQAAPAAPVQPIPASLFNPAQRLQNAYALSMARQQGSAGMPPGSHSGNVAGNPMSNAIAKAKALVAESLIGDDLSDDLKKLRDDPNVPLAEFERLAKTHAANRAPKQHDFSGNASDQQQHPAGQNMPLGNQGIGGLFGGRASLKPGGIAMKGPAGLTSAMAPAQQPQQEDPVVGMVNAFRGHVPDEQLAAVQRAINAGMSPQAALAHLQQAAQHQQTATASGLHQQERQTEQDRHTEFSENARRLDEARHRLDQITAKDAMLKSGNADLMKQSPNFAEYQKLQGVVQTLGNQLIQGKEAEGSKVQLPAPPKSGTQIDKATAMKFYQQAGGDPAKAKELIRQNGWSL